MAKTFPAILPCLRMDRIYSRGFDVSTIKVMTHPHWRDLSDHCALIAELELSQPPVSHGEKPTTGEPS